MGMLQGGPDMRFPPGHSAMIPRNMMRPVGRPSMPPGPMPGGMSMGGLPHSAQMQPGMAFNPGMMPGGPGALVRRAVSNPNLNPNLGSLNTQAMMQQQLIRQQQQMQIQQQHAQQERQRMEIAMMRGSGPPGTPQNPAVGRPGSNVMSSLSQPPSMSQTPHPGGMPGPHNFQSPIIPPPQSASPRARTPVMNMAPGPSQPPLNRQHMSDEMFMFQQQNGYPPMRGNGQFPFGPSPTPPLNMSESFPPSGGPGRPNTFPPTPAQQLSMQQQHGSAAENGFGYPMAPPRPPSNQHPMMQQQHSPPRPPSQHHSPHHSDHMNPHPPTPQSQPQQPQPPGRPHSSTGGRHTPRPPQPGLPNNPGLLPTGRIPISQPPGQNQPAMRPPSTPGSSSHQQPIAPRPPPSQVQPGPGSDSTLMSASASPPETDTILAPAIPRHPAAAAQAYSIGFGQGLIRVMQFSGLLGSDTPTVQSQKMHLSYWDNLIREYFTPKAIMKLTLWRDSMKNEAKPFEIGVPILPRFFLVTTQSGVKSMSLTLDGARERLFQPGHAIVECVSAVWTFRYNNGHIVTLRGPLTAHLVICAAPPSQQPQGTPGSGNAGPSGQGAGNGSNTQSYVLKFDDFEFDATSHEKYIALEAIAGTRRTEDGGQPGPPPASGPPANGAPLVEEEKRWEEPRQIIENGSIPGEPVNAFGIPQATMRCLELAESVGQMADLISFAKEQEQGHGPLVALQHFANKIREEQPQLAMMSGFGSMPYLPGGANGVGTSSLPPSAQGNTLYSSAPPSVTNPSAATAPQQPQQPQQQQQQQQQHLQPTPGASSSTMSSPQNGPPSAANSPQKQHKTIPTKGPATPGTANSTPAMANATLKRKAGATDPPTAAPEPAPKRTTRRRRTAGG
ncbi:LIM-domain binding protein-domain-containing protein [Favolaschia claudopus]|uniref:LIM-domain binding protein-domain-containing protein n=1 Tax=Favolaschia claudopus TaxID=2862362 RepID=A0AAW0EA17_9AGAR